METSFTADRPTVVNDPELTHECLSILKDMYGAEQVQLYYGQMPYSNEDFINDRNADLQSILSW